MESGAERIQRGSPKARQALRLVLRSYLRELRRHPGVSVGGLVMPALGNILIFYVPPLVVAHAAARFATGHRPPTSELTGYVLTFAGTWLLGELCARIGIHCLNRADSLGIADLYVDGLDALLAKDAVFFHDNFSGSLTKRVLSFASRYEEFLDTLSFNIVAEIVPVGFACVVLWSYDPVLVLVLVGLMLLSALLVTPLIVRRQVLVDAREAVWAEVSGQVADTLANMDAVRAFAAESREALEHRRRVERLRRATLRSWDYHNLRINTVISPMAVLTNTIGLVVAFNLSGSHLGVEAIIVSFTYFSQATRIMFEFNQTYRQLESALTEAAQFTELLLSEPTVLDCPAPVELAPQDSSVSFVGVRFSHGGPALFDGLDLHIESGERVGLVGRSGGGKTTLVRLLLRLMDIDSGRILIGGQDVAHLRQSDLRSLLSYVPQDPAMFHRTLRENIAFGRPLATEDEIRAAARSAHAMEFIDELPDGLDTLVGERGVKLSGGQRQRVAIARAILRDAPILLLDEATSALDSASEQHIQVALAGLMRGRTALVIAHRLSTVARMDRLVVLERGQVVEQGSHAQLVTAGGAYGELWAHQSGGFLADTVLSG